MRLIDASGFIRLINSQPTAYDPGRVVEQLEKLHTYTETVTMEKHPFCANNIETISKNRAIEIVKKGGME